MILRQDGADPTVGSGSDGGDGCHLPGGDASCVQIGDAGFFFFPPIGQSGPEDFIFTVANKDNFGHFVSSLVR
jgi:hypothetical protein